MGQEAAIIEEGYHEVDAAHPCRSDSRLFHTLSWEASMVDMRAYLPCGTNAPANVASNLFTQWYRPTLWRSPY
jgi:hypothetical protein